MTLMSRGYKVTDRALDILFTTDAVELADGIIQHSYGLWGDSLARMVGSRARRARALDAVDVIAGRIGPGAVKFDDPPPDGPVIMIGPITRLPKATSHRVARYRELFRITDENFVREARKSHSRQDSIALVYVAYTGRINRDAMRRVLMHTGNLVGLMMMEKMGDASVTAVLDDLASEPMWTGVPAARLAAL